MKEYQEKAAKMSEEEKKEQMLKSYTVLNNLPRSQAEQIIMGLAAAANLYKINVDEILKEELAQDKPPQLGPIGSVWA